MALEKEARTNIMGSSLDIRNRNWDKVSAHLADYASLLAGGQEYIATLLNGWTGNLTYRKNALGQVILSGSLTVGDTGISTTVAQIPSGYRPKNSLGIAVYNGGAGRVLTLFSLTDSGALTIRRPESENTLSTGHSVHIHVIFSTF